MSLFSELLKKAGTGADEKLPEVWQSQFPLSFGAFFPPPGKASGTFDGPRFSVTVFAEGHRLKLVMGSKGYPRKFWLTLEGPEGVLEQLEIALRTGAGEWRDAKDQE